MVASPPLRNHFEREPQDPKNTRIRVVSKAGSTHSRDNLLWLLELLLQDDQVFLCGLDNICDELEREIRSSQTSRERLSAWIADLISDLSLLAELKRQIGLSTPGPAMTQIVPEDIKQAEFAAKTKLISDILRVIKGTDLAKVGYPLHKFNYPSNKRRSLATTQRMQEAEGMLDMFWRQVDQQCSGEVGKTVHQLLEGVLKERPILRTSDWEIPAIDHKVDQNSQADFASTRLANMELEAKTEATVSALEIKKEVPQKSKTRGIPSEQSQSAPKPAQIHPEAIQGKLYKVSKRGFKIFTTLFYSPSNEDQQPPGEIAWSEFLSAMASVGFVIQKLDGSAWIFAPNTDVDIFGRSIIFHEPHPSSKIPFQVARRFGRRLERTYGWTSACFERA